MAECCPVWTDNLYVLPGNISFEEATLLDPMAVGIHAVNRSNLSTGETVAVIGVGVNGSCVAQAARVCGASKIFCLDKASVSLQISSKVGTGEPVDTTKTDVLQYIKKKTNNEGVDVVIDTVGEVELQKIGLKMLRRKGRLIILAVMDDSLSFPLTDISAERSITTSCSFTLSEYQIALDLLSTGKIKLKPLITHRFPLEEVNHAFEVASDKEKYGSSRVIILP